jgi:hypothetical protein
MLKTEPTVLSMDKTVNGVEVEATLQDRVTVVPAITEAGLAAKAEIMGAEPPMGVGVGVGTGLTVTVTWAVAVPPPLVAVRV